MVEWVGGSPFVIVYAIRTAASVQVRGGADEMDGTLSGMPDLGLVLPGGQAGSSRSRPRNEDA